jgi:hypothetical protein
MNYCNKQFCFVTFGENWKLWIKTAHANSDTRHADSKTRRAKIWSRSCNLQTFQSGLSCYSWYKLVTWIIYSFPDLLHLHKFELRGVFGFPMVKFFQNSQLIIIQFWNQSQNYGDSPHNYVISHLIIIHIYKQLVLMGVINHLLFLVFHYIFGYALSIIMSNSCSQHSFIKCQDYNFISVSRWPWSTSLEVS